MPSICFVPYTSAHQEAWFKLNEEWISRHFKMEASDYAILEDPQGIILEQGGHILMLEYDGIPMGTAGLLRMTDGPYDFELVKMCISPELRGKGLGYQLGLATLQLAREVGASSVYLESNSKLAPALYLYRKLGFQDVDGRNSPYARCNVKMAISL